MKFKKIVSTWLHSSDLEKTKEFMSQLGVSCMLSTEEMAVFNYQDGGPNTAYYLYPAPLNDGEPMRKGGVFTIQVDDLDEVIQHCSDKNLISEDVKVHERRGFKSFLLTDPDENLFEIIQKKKEEEN
ncbi:MAG: hypothetical protein GF308_05350 [Candidatus Heimdallarchaeota archaeon]|nr:hypothetical protein [Candidatus Heimdallarchaeota archaeon]